jgi:DNA-binding NarL/FixJ family response regulator
MTTRVMIADDQAMVRAGFAALLAAQDDFEVVGQAANGEEAVALAAEHAPSRSGPPQIAGLTERGREVLVEVARGRTNLEIAKALYIAEQTVKTHVSRVLAKLGARDRAQAVVAAYESGLVVARPQD